jgi:predicted TIM-barrel fold metal-dependent hydrolase
MDHAYKRHRYWLPPGQHLSKLPSEYLLENVYVTFQDDWTAFAAVNQLNWHRLLWANDFPHSDSTWPWSQEMLDEQTVDLTAEQKRAILSDNVAGLYGIDLATLS